MPDWGRIRSSDIDGDKANSSQRKLPKRAIPDTEKTQIISFVDAAAVTDDATTAVIDIRV